MRFVCFSFFQKIHVTRICRYNSGFATFITPMESSKVIYSITFTSDSFTTIILGIFSVISFPTIPWKIKICLESETRKRPYWSNFIQHIFFFPRLQKLARCSLELSARWPGKSSSAFRNSSESICSTLF